MKTVTGLNDTITNYRGDAVVDENGKELSFKDALVTLISRMSPTGKDRFVIYEVGKQLAESENGSFEFEDHPFELVRQEVKKTEMYTVIVTAPLEKMFEDANREANE